MAAQSILIVEDEGLIALHLMEILTNAGYGVLDPVSFRRRGIETSGGESAP